MDAEIQKQDKNHFQLAVSLPLPFSYSLCRNRDVLKEFSLDIYVLTRTMNTCSDRLIQGCLFEEFAGEMQSQSTKITGVLIKGNAYTHTLPSNSFSSKNLRK